MGTLDWHPIGKSDTNPERLIHRLIRPLLHTVNKHQAREQRVATPAADMILPPLGPEANGSLTVGVVLSPRSIGQRLSNDE